MIINSWVWKKELKKELRAFTKFSSITDFSDEKEDMDYIFLRIEKFFFVSSFIIRKLNESHKLSDELIGTNIALEKYQRKNISEPWDFISKYDIEKFFDFNTPIKCSLGAMKLCNNFIHSFFFYPSLDLDIQPGKQILSGVLFTSDKDSKFAMYYITLQNFFSFIQQVLDDDVVSLSFNRESGKIKKSRYYGEDITQ